MKTRLCLALALLALFATLAEAAQVQMAPKKSAGSLPRLSRTEGGLTIINRDWVSYYAEVDAKNGRINLSLTKPSGRGILTIASGDSASVALEANIWDVYGNTGERLSVGIHVGDFTQLQLVPTGEAGNSGLQGIVDYKSNRFSGDLFKEGSVTQQPGYGSYGQQQQPFGIGTGAQTGTGTADVGALVDNVVDQILGRSPSGQTQSTQQPFGQQQQTQNPFDQFNQQQQQQPYGQQYNQQPYGQQQQPFGQQQSNDVGSIVDNLVDSILGGNR